MHLPLDSKKTLRGLLEGGLDAWGSKRAATHPPPQSTLDDDAEEEPMCSTPEVPSMSELLGASPGDSRGAASSRKAEFPRRPHSAMDKVIGTKETSDPYGDFTRHVVNTIIRYRIYRDHDLIDLFEAAMDDFPELDRRRLQRIADGIHRQLHSDRRIVYEGTSIRPVTTAEPASAAERPASLEKLDPYELFAYDVVEKIVDQRLFEDDELLELFEQETAAHRETLDHQKMMKILRNIKQELSLSR